MFPICSPMEASASAWGRPKSLTWFRLSLEGVAGEPVALIGSGGQLEIFVNKGNAAKTKGCGAEVIVQSPSGQ